MATVQANQNLNYSDESIMHYFHSVGVVYKRQLLRLWTSKSRLISMLIMPLMWLLIIGQSFNNLLGSAPAGAFFPGGIDYITFMTPGILIMVTMFTSLFGVISLFYDRDSGYLKNYLIAPISNTAIIMGYALGIYTQVLLQVAIILVIGLAIGASLTLSLVNLLAIFLFPIASTFFLSGLAITLASRAPNVEVFQAMIMPISLPLMFLSPILYPTKNLPNYFEWIARINPLTFGVEGLRATLFGNSFASLPLINVDIFVNNIAIFNFLMLFVIGLFFLWIGSRAFLRSLIK